MLWHQYAQKQRDHRTRALTQVKEVCEATHPGQGGGTSEMTSELSTLIFMAPENYNWLFMTILGRTD